MRIRTMLNVPAVAERERPDDFDEMLAEVNSDPVAQAAYKDALSRRRLPRLLLVAVVALAVWALIVLLGLLVAPDAEAGSTWAGWNWP